MKELLFSILFLCSFLAYGQNSPVDHMGELSANYDQINKDTWDYIKQVSKGRNANRIEKKRKELSATLRSAKYDIMRVSPYKGDASLKNAYANYLNLSYLVINDDYKRIVDLEKIAEESYDGMEVYLLTKERVNKKLDSAHQILNTSIEAFATKYNINLVEGNKSRIQKKLENVSDITAYYNKVYLVFFKSNWYEGEMIKAMSNGDVGDIEQFRQTLESVTTEGNELLREIGSYKGNYGLRVACQKVLNFYLAEAKIHVPKQIEFFTMAQRIETMKKNMEAKKRNKLTKKEIDEYNKAINDYNKGVEAYNKTNNYLNDKRSEVLKVFDKASLDLYKEYM